jgi:hypothetical protein
MLSAGEYTVRAVRYQGPEWIRSYRRWSIRLEFALVHEPVSVSAFFNLGNDPNGYRVGRQSRFYKAWVIANGEHPRTGQFMDFNVFMEGQFFQVVVADLRKDSEKKDKQPAEVYSIVTQSPNQAINQSSCRMQAPPKAGRWMLTQANLKGGLRSPLAEQAQFLSEHAW